MKSFSQLSAMATAQAGPGSDFTLLQIGFATLATPLWIRQLAIASSGP